MVIKNQYTRNLWNSTKMLHQPFWGEKLITPTFYKDEKYAKFLKQWGIRLNLEFIKMRHALISNNPDKQTKQMMKEEIEAFIA